MFCGSLIHTSLLHLSEIHGLMQYPLLILASNTLHSSLRIVLHTLANLYTYLPFVLFFICLSCYKVTLKRLAEDSNFLRTSHLYTLGLHQSLRNSEGFFADIGSEHLCGLEVLFVIVVRMRSVEEKRCYGHQTQETPNSSAAYFEFHKGTNRTSLGKPTPSKWDDAQKWLVGLSSLSRGGEKSQSKNKPRNSNADDLRLIAPVPQKEQDFDDGEEEQQREEHATTRQHEAEETKKVECDESFWRINKPTSQNAVCVRDMGTEMTPIASQEPSRTATPIRATTPASRSPVHSGTSTPLRSSNGGNIGNNNVAEVQRPLENNPVKKLSPLESRALAWDEAEKAKYMARFKREEVKIQAWENHQIRKAEMEMKKMEVKAERKKARAQEKLANKLAATRRVAEEKRANAEAKLNEKALKTSERADYIRRTGHVPSAFSFHFKLPSLCW